jgi:hypothetical protein
MPSPLSATTNQCGHAPHVAQHPLRDDDLDPWSYSKRGTENDAALSQQNVRSARSLHECIDLLSLLSLLEYLRDFSHYTVFCVPQSRVHHCPIDSIVQFQHFHKIGRAKLVDTSSSCRCLAYRKRLLASGSPDYYQLASRTRARIIH